MRRVWAAVQLNLLAELDELLKPGPMKGMATLFVVMVPQLCATAFSAAKGPSTQWSWVQFGSSKSWKMTLTRLFQQASTCKSEFRVPRLDVAWRLVAT